MTGAFPRADGKRYAMDVSFKKKYGVDDSAHDDPFHTDRLDNFTAMEVTLKSRCHGHHDEGLAYDITPAGMHCKLQISTLKMQRNRSPHI